MAVTAKFQADFSSFLDAIDKAELSLVDFGKGADKVESSLNRMVDSFSGRKLIQEASLMTIAVEKAGGVAALTANQIAMVGAKANEAADKLTRLGYEVPAGLQKLADQTKSATGNFSDMSEVLSGLAGAFGIAFSASALVGFVKSTIETTAALEDLSKATGVSMDGLQRLSYVGVEAGLGIDQMARGVEQLSAKLAGGDKNATTAVDLLGLSLSRLLTEGPEQAFIDVAEAVGRIDDPMTKAAIASDLWGGRLSKQLIPLLGELRVKMAEVPKDAIISDDNIQKAKAFEDGLAHTETKLKAWTASIFGAASAYNTWLESGTGLSGFLDLLHGRTAVATKDTSDHAVAVDDAATSTIHLTDTVKDRIEADAKAAEQLKQFNAAMVEIDAAGVGWRGTLDTINGSVAEAIRYYLEAGVSQKALADAYGLTATQIKSVATELSEEQKALKLTAAATEEVTRIWDEFNQMASKGGSTFDDQIAAIDRWAADLMAKAQKAGTDTAAFYEALTALWNAKLHAAAQATSGAIQETGDTARSVFAEMNDEVMGIITSFDGWNDAIMNVKRSLDGTIQSEEELQKAHDRGNSLDIGTAAQDPLIMEFLKQGYSLKNAEALKLGRQYGFTPSLFDNLGNPESSPSKGERVPGYASGVRNAPGGWSMVGERGPEAMYVPQGADILPSGTRAGGQTIQIYITQPLGTPDAIAKAVDTALMSRQRNIGARY